MAGVAKLFRVPRANPLREWVACVLQVALLRCCCWVLVLLGATAATTATQVSATIADSATAVGMPLVLEQCSPVFDPRQQYTFSLVPPYTNHRAGI